MKRSFTTLLLSIIVAIAASAQSGLYVNQIFGEKYASDPSVAVTMMSGEHRYLKKHSLSVFITFSGPAKTYASILEPLVLSDGKKALGKNVRYRKGQLYFAFYILPAVKVDGEERKRYLYYINSSGQRGGNSNVMLIYLEGTLSEQSAASLITSISNN